MAVALGTALKIGGRVVGSILKRAKAKRAEKRLQRRQRRAERAEAETKAMFAKLGFASNTAAGGGQSSDNNAGGGAVEDKIPSAPKPKKKVSLVLWVVAFLGAIFLFRFFGKRSR